MTDAEALRRIAESLDRGGSAYALVLQPIADRVERLEGAAESVVAHLSEYHSGKRPYVDVLWCKDKLLGRSATNKED